MIILPRGRVPAAALAALFLFACDPSPIDDPSASDPPGESRTLSCEMMTGPNCWKDALAELQTCGPPPDVDGILDGAARRCDYPDGTVVDLIDVGDNVDLEVHTNDGLCFGFQVTESPDDWAFRITTQSGMTTWEGDGGLVRLTCPDGSSYEAGMFSVFGCEGVGQHLPGYYALLDLELQTTLGLLGAGGEGVPAFSCLDPSLVF